MLQPHLELPQYSLTKILAIWAAAAIPTALLAWVVTPMLVADPQNPGFMRVGMMTIGLAWQCLLTLILVYREAGDLRWSTLKARLWLRIPRSSRTAQPRKVLLWWLLPLIVLKALDSMALPAVFNIDAVWVKIFPFFAEPAGFSFGAFLGSEAGKASMIGRWDLFLLFLVMALFNTVIGEELLFRGLLLPRMNGRFGKWDWVVNGVLFGLYHLAQPWMIPSGMVSGMVFFALPTKYFRSAWFGIVLHSGQSVFLMFLMLGLVLGLA